MKKATKRQIEDWIGLLMARQAITLSADEVDKQIKLAAPSFQMRFPASAFCGASLDHVASVERYWNEARIVAALEAWQRTQEPTGPALPAEVEAAPVSREAKWWLASWYRAETDQAAERALDLIRSHSAEAFAYLCEHDFRAADVAVARRWPVPGQDRGWTEQGVRDAAHKVVSLRGGTTGFQVAIAQIALTALTMAVRVNAPEHGEALFDELRWIAAGMPSESPEQPQPKRGLFT